MFEALDWSIIIGYLAFTFAIGMAMTRKASKGIKSYFGADRSIPWWWLGISIAATTFAADTPLAVTGIVASDGIAGNWLWWSWGITYITITVVFASRWHQSNVLTDVEFIELRYEGKPASVLRGFKAVYLGIIFNCFILGWVFTAMTKITDPFIQWELLLGSSGFASVESWWPGLLLFNGSLNTTLTVLAVTLVVVVYSSLGGIRGVIFTDLFQFIIALGTAIIFAVYAVNYVGGLDELYYQLEVNYGERAEYFLDFFPSADNPMLPMQIFLIYVLVQWWARYDSDGTGYIAQRLNTAKSPSDARKGSLLFSVLFLALRTWPWVIVGLVALVVFPVGDPNSIDQLGVMSNGAVDREMGYPVLMKLVLPVGLLGLTFTSLMAAFMSTVDTHFNWGASYLVNDVYKRFIDPEASQKKLVKVSRYAVLGIALLAIIVSSQMSSIGGAWKFFFNMATGMGVAQLMRWLWWRANAWTEVSGMATALILTIVFSIVFPEADNTFLLAWISCNSLAVSILITLMTDPVSDKKLMAFADRTSPIGFWNGYSSVKKGAEGFGKTAILWVLGITIAYSSMFSIGYFIKLDYWMGMILGNIFIVSLGIWFWLNNKVAD